MNTLKSLSKKGIKRGEKINRYNEDNLKKY